MKSAACFCLLLMTSFVGAAPTDPPGSLYHLNVSMQNQRGENHGLDVARGYPVLVTMFYGSCPAACPLIIETLQVIESDLTIADRGQVRVLMISLDPKQDTPEALRDLAKNVASMNSAGRSQGRMKLQYARSRRSSTCSIDVFRMDSTTMRTSSPS